MTQHIVCDAPTANFAREEHCITLYCNTIVLHCNAIYHTGLHYIAFYYILFHCIIIYTNYYNFKLALFLNAYNVYSSCMSISQCMPYKTDIQPHRVPFHSVAILAQRWLHGVFY